MIVEILCGGYGCPTRLVFTLLRMASGVRSAMPKQPALSGWVWRNARFLRPLPRKPPLRTFRQLRKVTTPPQPKPRRTALRRHTSTPTSCRA